MPRGFHLDWYTGGGMGLPEHVVLTEVGPRDGLQMEAGVVPTAKKAELIKGLVAAGFDAIQVTAFVHPGKVPQMADADKVVAQLPREDGVQYSALTLNCKGVERACRTNIPWIEVSISASERHSRQNAGLTREQAREEARNMIELALAAGRKVRASIQCAFGYIHGGRIPADRILAMADLFLEKGADQLVLADTTGLATPPAVRNMLTALLPAAGSVPVGLHLHDTRGLGLVNLMAALEMGITRFDTSLGGLGGCPFVPGAAGNIATEDTVFLMQSLGITTGIDLEQVASWSRQLSQFFNHKLPGKMYRLPA